MNSEKIAAIILSKILEMPLWKYLAFIETAANGKASNPFHKNPKQREKVYARLVLSNGNIYTQISDKRLIQMYSIETNFDKKTACTLRWINTRNRFSSHILQSLLEFQREYWLTGNEMNLQPLTFTEFLRQFPLEHLEQSRLSRLAPNLVVLTPDEKMITLRSLFASKKRWHSYQVKRVIDESDDALTDVEIQQRLAQKGIALSVRTICNCRKHLSIPHFRARASEYYGRDISFSEYLSVSEKKFNKIPAEPGIYELSLAGTLDYTKHKSDVIYIGSSSNLRKRIASYSSKKLKNSRLRNVAHRQEMFVRYAVIDEHKETERILLKAFKTNYGELPKANYIGDFL
ncbi:MAG: GIY-YIG nuclease family protein [Bacteroidetes bacterium]|nr:GIY-YIG nuclease family protein [Bacteroidota bacterium]